MANNGYDPNQPRDERGRWTDGKGFYKTNMPYSEILKVDKDTLPLDDIYIGISVGAKAKNYEVMDLKTGEIFHFVEGTKMQDVEVFAGKNTSCPFKKSEKYAHIYGGDAENWQHVKCVGVLDTPEGHLRAKIHWVQCEGIGKFEFFVKEWID